MILTVEYLHGDVQKVKAFILTYYSTELDNMCVNKCITQKNPQKPEVKHKQFYADLLAICE